MQTVPSSELKAGDIVTIHGMRVQLEKLNCAPYPGHANSDLIYSWDGTVLNRDEVPTDLVPYSFTRTDTDRHQWTVQGNDRVGWRVES